MSAGNRGKTVERDDCGVTEMKVGECDGKQQEGLVLDRHCKVVRLELFPCRVPHEQIFVTAHASTGIGTIGVTSA
ncbi:hypothetical protein H8B02_05435 [Bradyrhizobium sp. Pear77]|uniref:hypothetical protein n=1 Tax=Bradyrhizobium altum TaxID=1571202 RepID=UPI001E4A109D|nr:hypothetical protein [Bradyrhizobium altum]MCC8952925.1 hypothetical protein [Bradyrhizobium altum]